MKLTMGQVTFDNRVFTAPLAGISDKAFRLILQKMNPGMTFTEMISAKALVYQNQKTFELMDTSQETGPIATQIFGSDPEYLAKGARIMVERGAGWIDFNMGCPAPKVVKNQEGSALMLTPDLAYQAVESLVKAVDIPVSVKLRKGFDAQSVNVVEMSRQIASLGVAAITVHARTRDQFYSGQADWEVIAEVVNTVDIPVIGNGDILSPWDGLRMREQTACEAVMIGRGLFGNPWLVAQNIAVMQGEEPTYPDMETQLTLAKEHLRLAVFYRGERIGVREMRKHLSWYLKHGRGAARMRARLNETETYAGMLAVIDDYASMQRSEYGQN